MQPDELTMNEMVVITAIASLLGDAYGLSIQNRIRERTGSEMPLGSIYLALERLEDRKFVVAREGDPIAQRGGKRRRFFTVTGAGRAAQAQALRKMEQLRDWAATGGAVWA